MRNFWLGWGSLVMTIAVGAACGGKEDPPGLGGQCMTSDCTPVDSGVITTHNDGSTAPLDAGCMEAGDAAPFTGTMATLHGTISHSPSPLFPAIPTSGNTLSFAATVHFEFGGNDYSAAYNPAGDGGGAGFTLLSPPGNGFMYVTDIAGQNDFLDTGAGVDIADGDTFSLPAVSRSEIDAIFAAQNPPLTRDLTKSQIIFSIQESPINGSGPVANVVFNVPGTKDAILYDVAGGTFARGDGTGPSGIAIVVNYAEVGCAMSAYHFAYTANGNMVDNLTFLAMPAKVMRVPVELASH